MTYQDGGDVFGGGGVKYLAPSRGGQRRATSGNGVTSRKSTASLRGSSSLAEALGDDAPSSNGKHSLAHELAFALMPEPSAGSKLLQEEFGIEYDEGAEGIDEQPDLPNENVGSLAQELGDFAVGTTDNEVPSFAVVAPLGEDLTVSFGSSGLTSRRQTKQTPVQDPMDALSKDLESTDKFILQLRQLDADSGPSSTQPSIEKIASDIIRHINETARDREGQVRELLEYEREFRKIAGEVNGNDVLGLLDALDGVEGLSDKGHSAEPSRSAGRSIEMILEDKRLHQRDTSNDWELNPDDHHLGDDDVFDDEPDSPSPTKDAFPQPPPMTGPLTITKMLPQIVHVRTLTTSLATSLTAISEHAQVNGAANADAGRKIRALKNKLGGWRSDWDSAERSRFRIERWEAGLPDDDPTPVVPGTPPRSGSGKRPDGRRLVEEHLRAFEIALVEAGTKTRAIMAKT